MGMDLLAGMRVFAAVVDAGSFARASEGLNLSRGMATRYVAQLEAELGVRLLNRTTRKLSLTEAGSDYYQRAVQVLGLVEEAGNAVASGAAAPRGTLRVATSIGFGIRHLDRAVSAFLKRHPGVEVAVTVSERAVDLVEEGYDLAVRIAVKIDPGLVARRIARIRTVLCGAPAYLAARGAPRSPEQLSAHNCLGYLHRNWQNRWRVRRRGVERSIPVSGNFRCDNGNLIVNAGIDGLGLINVPEFLADEALRSGQLVRILPDWETDELSLFAVYPNRKYLPPKVRSFVDFLVEYFGPRPYWEIDARRR